MHTSFYANRRTVPGLLLRDTHCGGATNLAQPMSDAHFSRCSVLEVAHLRRRLAELWRR